MRNLCLIIILSCISLNAQSSDKFTKVKKVGLITGEALFYTQFTYQSSQRFFQDYPISPFAFVNDFNYWKGMDKAFHSYFNYSFNKINYQLYKWAGFDKNQASLYSGLNTFILMGTKEWIDGRIDVGGFSTRDILANLSGSAVFILQEHLWEVQKVKLKYSFNPFGSDLYQYNPSELGVSLPSRMFRNYNEITFWLSTSLQTFLPNKECQECPQFNPKINWKKVVGIAFGYSVEGLLSSKTNEVIEYTQGLDPIDRVNQYYLGLDLHLSNIPTNKKALKVLFFLADHIKLPLPGIGIDSKGKIKASPFVF